MPNNQGTLVSAPIRPFSPSDTYPAFLANEGQGGWHQAADLTALALIPAERLVDGMPCWVTSLQAAYQWTAGTGWAPASFGTGGGGGPAPLAQLTYGESFGTNECFKNTAGTITHVTSLDVAAPWVDGITLESGALGDTYAVAVLLQQSYTTPLILPASTRTLFLGQDGKLTGTAPSAAAGDVWSYPVARRISDYVFILAPGLPIQLAAP